MCDVCVEGGRIGRCRHWQSRVGLVSLPTASHSSYLFPVALISMKAFHQLLFTSTSTNIISHSTAYNNPQHILSQHTIYKHGGLPELGLSTRKNHLLRLLDVFVYAICDQHLHLRGLGYSERRQSCRVCCGHTTSLSWHRPLSGPSKCLQLCHIGIPRAHPVQVAHARMDEGRD